MSSSSPSSSCFSFCPLEVFYGLTCQSLKLEKIGVYKSSTIKMIKISLGKIIIGSCNSWLSPAQRIYAAGWHWGLPHPALPRRSGHRNHHRSTGRSPGGTGQRSAGRQCNTLGYTDTAQNISKYREMIHEMIHEMIQLVNAQLVFCAFQDFNGPGAGSCYRRPHRSS